MPHGMHALNAHARMYYGNGVRLNKIKIRWKVFVLFLIYRKFHYYIYCVILNTSAMWQVYVI